MNDETKINSDILLEDANGAEEIEDEFEILNMDSDESKVVQKEPNVEGADDEERESISEDVELENSDEPETIPECQDQKKDGGASDEQKIASKSEDDVDDDGEDKTWDWNSWTNWGSSVINTAANSVTTFTSQVGDGFIQVLETVESGLLAQDDDDEEKEEKKKIKEAHEDQPITDQNINPKVENPIKEETATKDESPSGISSGISSGKSWLFSSLSNVVSKTTSVVQQTTNVVVHGGLDMLETIGKKTYNVITEGDNGLKKVIEKNKQQRQMPNLSQVLKEAREISDLKSREEETLLESKKFLYSYWFDEYQGLVELEAFELLANQNEAWSRKEYDRLSREKLAIIKKRLAEINEIYKTIDEDSDDDDTDDKQDFRQLLLDYAAKLPFNISVQKLLECQDMCRRYLNEHENWKPSADDADKDLALTTPKDVLQKSMLSLALLTAFSIQHFHKLAQLVSESSSGDGSPFSLVSVAEMAKIVVGFSKILNKEFSTVSGKFATILGRFESPDSNDCELSTEVSEYITTVYLEASNSNNFVQRSLKLLLPALQVATMKTA